MSNEFDVFDDVLSGSGESEKFKVPPEQLTPDPNQPRRHFKESKLVDLAGSIDDQGQLETVKVWPQNDQGIYEIFDGERRWRSISNYCQSTSEVECEIYKGERSKITQVHFNNFAEQLDDVEMAYVCAELKASKMPNEQIAKEVKRHKDEISRLLAIAKMPEEVAELYKIELVEEGRALYFLTKSYDINKEETINFIENVVKKEGGVTAKKTETLLKMLKSGGSVGVVEQPSESNTEDKSLDDLLEPGKDDSTPLNSEAEPGSSSANPEATPENDPKTDLIKHSNVRIEVDKNKGYLVTVKKSKKGKCFVKFDEDDKVSEVAMAGVEILAVE